MKEMDSQELDRRIDNFLTKKQQEYPELKLRSSASQSNVRTSISETLMSLATGLKLNFSR
jgi:hypothetical protein